MKSGITSAEWNIAGARRTAPPLREPPELVDGFFLLTQVTDLEEMLEHVLRTILERTHGVSANVWEANPAGDWFNLVASLENDRFQNWEGEPSRPAKISLLTFGSATAAHQTFVPMTVAGEVVGLVGVCFDPKRALGQTEAALLRTFAPQVYLALHLTRSYRTCRQNAVAAERNRIARDLHDTLAQGFTGVALQLETARGALARNLPAEASEHIDRAGALARESLGEVRRSVGAMRPRALEGISLSKALAVLMQKMTAGTDLRTEFTVQGGTREIPPHFDESLYRIGQEALTNALRHAQATEFTAQLFYASHEIRLDLRDNGKGFNPLTEHAGFGLLGIRERIEALGGRLSIESSCGTLISVALPLP